MSTGSELYSYVASTWQRYGRCIMNSDLTLKYHDGRRACFTNSSACTDENAWDETLSSTPRPEWHKNYGKKWRLFVIYVCVCVDACASVRVCNHIHCEKNNSSRVGVLILNAGLNTNVSLFIRKMKCINPHKTQEICFLNGQLNRCMFFLIRGKDIELVNYFVHFCTLIPILSLFNRLHAYLLIAHFYSYFYL